jgi:23S rRNA A2030 N6-methylase RlmJ
MMQYTVYEGDGGPPQHPFPGAETAASPGVLLYHAKDTLLEEFDKHSGRARYDCHERVVRSVREYRARLDEAWEQTIRGISSALQRAVEQQSKRVEMRQRASDTIAAEQTRLRAVHARLQDLRVARDDADPVPST